MPILDWGADLLYLSEVRTPGPQQKTLMRLAKSRSYSLLFSPPPPPSPTFSCSPGGVALAAREPIVIRKIYPPLLQRWYEEARMLCCLMVRGDFAAILVSIYAYPRSNPRREANEEMLADLFGWAASLTMPILIGGDFNEVRETSSCLTLAYRLGLYFLSPTSSTTRTKSGEIGRGHAIDHFIGNMRMRECMAWAEPNYERSLSDHFPLEGSFICQAPQLNVWHWPSPLRLNKNCLVAAEWVGQARTYVEWCKLAETWLGEAYQTSGDSKLIVTSSPASHKTYKPDPTYQTICAAQRALRHLLGFSSPTETQLASFRRKLIGLGLTFVSLDQAERDLATCLADYLKNAQKNVLADWRKRVLSWSVSSKQLYDYVRNLAPRKCFGLKSDLGVTNNPHRIYKLLHEYWGQIEKWPTPTGLQDALTCAEDLYGMFLPYHEAAIDITPLKLSNAVRTMKKSSPGLDGWDIAELRALPMEAWIQLASLLNSPRWNPSSSLLGAFRRVPVEKVSLDSLKSDLWTSSLHLIERNQKRAHLT